jgi:riboflavin-specific deaminase-like protein
VARFTIGAMNPELADIYAPLASGPFVLGQLGQSLDGRIATASGHSHTIGGPAAIAHLHRLRALADAVVVGISTVLIDDPRLTVRDAAGPDPVRVVIDPNNRLPADARFLARDDVPCFVLQSQPTPRPSRVTALTLPHSNGRLDPHAIIEALARRGLHRLLIEGGGHTVSTFLAAGALTRLHVCVTPVLIGSGPTGICLPDIAHMSQAMRPTCRTYKLGADILFDLAFDAVA